MLSLFLAFVLMSFVCCLNVIPLSIVTPRILVLCVTGRGVLLNCVAAASCFGCCESIARSSAYDMERVFGCEWVSMSCMNKMNSVGERTDYRALRDSV